VGESVSHIKNLSSRRIAGFACNQGFIFFFFYMGINRGLSLGNYFFERAELFGSLICMVVAFLILAFMPEKWRNVLLGRAGLALSACLLAAGSLVVLVFDDLSSLLLLAKSALIGLPLAFLLTSWGRDFGKAPIKVSVSEVFLASLIAALFGLIVSFIPFEPTDFIFSGLPLISGIMLIASPVFKKTPPPLRTNKIPLNNQTTALISLKIMAGTALFGLAAGLMETYNTDPGTLSMVDYPLSLLLFAAFVLGTLSLLFSDGFGKGAALNKAYRLALFIMIAGFLLIPLTDIGDMVGMGKALVFTGYLALMAVLISLFLVLANIMGKDAIHSFSQGFAALFCGEFIGIAIANAITFSQPQFITPYHVVFLAGILVLFSYIFLFTERDFLNLSEIVQEKDSLEEVCLGLVSRFSLSPREADVLPFILRGRTSERISKELYISKSTVDTHVRRIYAKTGVHSRQELIDLSEAEI
jgi:DNA-binding CsgD family transcriptional regulator